jgi:hypothetical protein
MWRWLENAIFIKESTSVAAQQGNATCLTHESYSVADKMKLKRVLYEVEAHQ